MIELSENLKTAYMVDDNGFILEVIVVDISEVIPDNVVIDNIENYYHTPRWDGTAWVEGETAEEKAEREAQQMLESLKPSQNEIEDAELEIKMITMLTEMGVIQ
ncbi:hypothetical protein LYSIN_01228 [Lysinibacillus sphaericus]|uniref:Uncharacterized protein n=1 Tax=Lysinibacillus sphaericus TaxID=1421 RepID=A0A2S5D070_LYSSH|nr:hypothetical protein [Lysinibacillus sphaericus]POZ56445.1 hypothetical protein LYSIN_01228 [Lysinibacillus sphaericus]